MDRLTHESLDVLPGVFGLDLAATNPQTVATDYYSAEYGKYGE